jgi:hypothetical protein
LVALAAVATAEPFGAGRSTAVVAAPGGTVAAAAGGAVVPAAATSIAGLTGTPLEVAAALVGAAMAFGAAPPGLAGLSVGGSSSAAAKKVRTPPPRPPTKQRLSYVPKHGFATAMVPLLARSKERLTLPVSFIGTMGKNPPTSFMIEDGSGGQPLYDVEVLHDEEGKSYLIGGVGAVLHRLWPRAGMVSHPDPPRQVTHPLPRRRRLRLRPCLLPWP